MKMRLVSPYSQFVRFQWVKDTESLGISNFKRYHPASIFVTALPKMYNLNLIMRKHQTTFN